MTIDWRPLSMAMAAESPVFIAGIPRSGTSVLRFTLGRLPSFRGRDEKAAETFVFVRPESISEILGPSGRRLLRYFFGNRAEAEALLGALAAIGFDPSLLLDRDRGMTFEARAARWRDAKADHALRIFFHHARRARAVRRILEKTPTHVHYVPEITASFPAAKFLFCLRHPVDTYASFKKRLASESERGRGERRLEWLRVSAGRFCGDYAKVVRDIDEAITRDPSVGVIVDYDSLTTKPRESLRRVCEFIGEEFDESVLFAATEEVRAGDGTPRPEGRLTANSGDWSRHLARDEAIQIETRLSAILDRFGYPRRIP